jgi:hypothetical protein
MIADRIYDLLPSDWPLVIGSLPSTHDEVVGIFEYDGATSTEYFATKNASSIYQPIIQIVIRAKSYEVGTQWAEEIKETLHRYHDDYLLSVLLVGTPVYLGRTPEKLHEFQVTFRTQVKE